MINNKVVLTYKRKHASFHSDPVHVKEGDTSSKSSRRIPKSATLNEPLEGDHKPVKGHLHDSNGTVLDSCSCSKTSECNDPSSEPTTQGEHKQHHATHVEQHDNVGEMVQQQVQESDKTKRSESGQGFEKDPTEHSLSSSLHTEVSVKESVFSKNSDAAFLDSKSTFANGALHNKAGFESPDCHIAERSDPMSLDSTQRKCTSLCREEDTSETCISGGKGFSLVEKPDMVVPKTVHKEGFGNPLRTFHRRAKKIKDIGEAEMCGNLKFVRGEGSVSEHSRMLDAIFKSEGPRDHSTEVPVQAKGHSDSNHSSLNLNGDDMVKKLQETATQEPSPGNLIEKEKSKEGAAQCTDGSNFTIKETNFFVEDRHVEVRSNCPNDFMKESSSEVNHRDKQFKLPETGSLIQDVPAVSSVGAVKNPMIRRISNECLEADNPCQSEGPHPHINLYELAPNKISAGSKYETRKPMDNASNENLICSRGSSNGAIVEATGSCEPLETKKKLKQRVACTTMAEVDINCRLACSGDDTLGHLPMKSVPDLAVLDFLRESTNHTTSPQKGHLVRNKGNSILESQLGTQETGSICMDFLGSVRIQQDNVVDHPIKDFRSISPIPSLKSTGYAHELQLPWQTLDSNSSIFRHKQILDDIITSSRMLNKRHDSYFANCRKYPSFWSEEELDSLWIGVRRHGRGNWNAMLGDPKLHFAGWRIADDLAERWDMEQSKLLTSPSVQPVRSLEPDHSLSSIISNRLLSNSAVDSSHRSYLPECQNSRNETGLSLGGVYLKKEGKSANRNPIQLLDLTVHPLAANGSLGAGSSYSYRGHQRHALYTDSGVTHQRPGKSLETYDLGPSLLERNSVERLPGAGNQMAALSSSSNLPHWLKEVLGTPTTPSEQAVLSSVSTFDHSMVSHSSDPRVIPPFSYPSDQLAPLKDARRGILKRRGTKSINASILGVSALKSAESKVSDANILDLNQSSSEAIEQNNLVILDGDASSEETISDDQGSRL